MGVLYSEALWQRAIFSLQGLCHDVDMFSGIGPSHLHWHHTGGEGLYGIHILGEHYLIIAIWVRLFFNAITYLHSHHSMY